MAEPRPRSSLVLRHSSRRTSYLASQDERENVVEHFEQVVTRIEEITRQSKHLASVLKKKVSVDKEHMKAVHKMTQSMHEDGSIKNLKFEGFLERYWVSIKEQLSAEAMHASRVASTLEQQALQPLQVYILADLDKRFHSLAQEGRRMVKDYTSARSTLLKTRDKYYGFTAEWEGSLLAIRAESGDSWSPTPGSKLYEREGVLCRKMEEGKAEYEAAVKQTNETQLDILGTQLPQVLESLRNVAENMVAVMHNTLKCFSDMQYLILHGSKDKEAVHEQFNAADYCQRIVFRNIRAEAIPHPQPYIFVEYPYQDNTLVIQTKKVQYYCMSKLSAKELANRAHQFLAEGDKKKSAQSLQQSKKEIQNNHNNAGVNTHLVSTCLEYLHQPVALKEEGLFRVSGDASIMRSLLSDFTSGRASKEFLREAVMNQKDPNNISGLLKMHLRENNLLSERSVQSIGKVLGQGMNEILDAILNELSAMELQMLTNIVELLHTMVQPEWRTHNKMTPHTLGIACGLSLFPQLDPSKATAFTQYIIDNYPTLETSQTVL